MEHIKRIKQVVECNRKFRACFWNEESQTVEKQDVYFMAVIEDGLHPLVTTEGGFLLPATGMRDYLGLEEDDEDLDFSDKIKNAKKNVHKYRDAQKAREEFRKKMADRINVDREQG
jgi:hypothetical protein